LRKERTAWLCRGAERYKCYVQSATESWEKERTAWLCDGTELYRCYFQSATESWEKERTAWLFDGTELYRCYVQSATESWEKERIACFLMGRSCTDVMFIVQQRVEKRKNSVALWWDGAVLMLCSECNRNLRKERTAWLCGGTELYRCYVQSATEGWEKKEQRGFVVGRNCTDVIFRVQQIVEKRKNSVALWWDGTE
jgi:hypothetical protein